MQGDEHIREAQRRGIPSATGLTWYRRDTYDRCLSIFDDAANMPRSFDDWRLRVKEAEEEIARTGRVIRVVIDPDTFPTWCAENGFDKIDAEARSHFASVKAIEWLRSQDK